MFSSSKSGGAPVRRPFIAPDTLPPTEAAPAAHVAAGAGPVLVQGQAEDAAQAAGRQFPIMVELSKPYQTHKGPQSRWAVREPTMLDWINIGDPEEWKADRFGDDGRPEGLMVVTDRERIIEWAVALTGHDRIVIGSLSYADGQRLIAAVKMALVVFKSGKSQSAPTS